MCARAASASPEDTGLAATTTPIRVQDEEI